MTDKDENYKREYILLLLLIFLFAALLALLFIGPIKLIIPDNAVLNSLLAFGIITDSLLAASLNGVILLPCITFFFGAASALEAERIRLLISGGEKFLVPLLWLLALTALHFMICFWGMCTSAEIRAAFDSKGCLKQKKQVIAYIIMLAGAVVFAAAEGLIRI